MQGQGSHGGRCGGFAPRVGGLLFEDFLKRWSDVAPRAHVVGLLLRPDETGARMLAGKFGKPVPVQRVDLLHANDRGVGDPVLLPVVGEIVVDLARAENEAGRLRRPGRIVDDLLKRACSEFVDTRDDRGMAQQGLG